MAHDNVNQLLMEHRVDTIVVDFCPTFHDLLCEIGLAILPNHLAGEGGYDAYEVDVLPFVHQCIERMAPLLQERKIILVIDGDRHPVKGKTHELREQEAKSAFIKAKAEFRRQHGDIEGNQTFATNAKKWLRYTSNIKGAIVEVRFEMLSFQAYTNVVLGLTRIGDQTSRLSI
ncbi:hypothetical protein K492DRAFT_58690 [Lichtheimia hyalospora FSU 10163]|nr:hypothetical protein K492DRAFT_58690 [Lichtheimia hyalospora FSU 10163]